MMQNTACFCICACGWALFYRCCLSAGWLDARSHAKGGVQVCHWTGQCLTPQQAQELNFQAVTPIISEDKAGSSSGGLSDAAKLVIMLSMGTLLLVIAAVCAWLLLRNRKTRFQRAASAAASGSGSRRQSRRPSQRTAESGVTPRSSGAQSAPASVSSQAKCSPSQSRKTSATSASREGQEQNAHAWPVPVDITGCPMSM